MSINYKIKNPAYVDLQKTTVSFQIVKEDGTTLSAQLKVPENKQRGINEYWDRILDEFDIELMRKQRNDLELRNMKMKEINDKKQKAATENERLRKLFALKIKAFDYPFIVSATDDVKAAIRRSSSEEILNLIVSSQINKFVQENNMTYLDLIDYLEDLEDQKEQKK